MASRDAIASSLRERATQLWGHERAEALRDIIERTADHLWQISQDPPPPDEEPGFYF
jgi:hypothetical protein